MRSLYLVALRRIAGRTRVRLGRSALVFGVSALGGLISPLQGQEAGQDQGQGQGQGQRWASTALEAALGDPLPFEVRRVFPELAFDKPVEVAVERGTDRLWVAEVDGRIWAFDPTGDGGTRSLLLDLRAEVPGAHQLYGLALHPRFEENRLVYLCYVRAGTEPDGSKVIECRVSEDTGRIEVGEGKSREVITWLAGGHNGGALQFGPDGYLYISTGDGSGPNPPDILEAGQDCRNLLSAVLRIDVDRRDPGLGYRVPPDNPFSDSAGLRPEIWAYGFRNPWRMTFDRESGELWVGDVGWDTWELVFYVRRGDNFGWSVMEGRQPIRVDGDRGPTPIVPPIAEHSHAEARSLTGGYVYYGDAFPELRGAYIYGDYETGKIWALWQRDGERLALRELADTTLRIICFAQTPDGEVLVVDYAGGIYELARRPEDEERQKSVPERLSETGLFRRSADGWVAAPGVMGYAIEEPKWTDGLVAEHWLALPVGGEKVNRASFPEGSVLVKTLRTGEKHPVETQILQRWRGAWRAFSYAWDEGGEDARLVPEQGMEGDLGGKLAVPRRFASRSECLVCHQVHAGYVLGFSSWQLREESWERLVEAGFLEGGRRGRGEEEAEGLEAAARRYLEVNCACCHRDNGGGLVPLLLGREVDLERMQAVGVVPQRGDFGIPDARVIVPGVPERSTLYYRMAKHGSGRMPHLGSRLVDAEGLELIARWIEGMDPGAERNLEGGDGVSQALVALREGRKLEAKWLELPEVRDLLEPAIAAGDSMETRGLGSVDPVGDEGVGAEDILDLEGSVSTGETLLKGPRGALCLTCHSVHGSGGKFGPPLDGLGSRRSVEQLLSSLREPSREVETAYVFYTVTTHSGEVYTGRMVHHGAGGLVLMDAAGGTVELAIETLKTMTASPHSAMPPGLLGAFTKQEAADLLAYLRSLQ